MFKEIMEKWSLVGGRVVSQLKNGRQLNRHRHWLVVLGAEKGGSRTRVDRLRQRGSSGFAIGVGFGSRHLNAYKFALCNSITQLDWVDWTWVKLSPSFFKKGSNFLKKWKKKESRSPGLPFGLFLEVIGPRKKNLRAKLCLAPNLAFFEIHQKIG